MLAVGFDQTPTSMGSGLDFKKSMGSGLDFGHLIIGYKKGNVKRQLLTLKCPKSGPDPFL